MSRRTVVAASIVLLGALALAACTPRTGPQPGTSPVPSPTEYGALELEAAWLDDGRMIGLVTFGSSTCVPRATETAYDGGMLTVTLAEPDGACTNDLVPRASAVAVPEGVDPSRDLPIEIRMEHWGGQTELDGVEGLAGPGGSTAYEPSAGWTGEDDRFVLLTWGSSTCVPVPQDVAATGPAQITVTIAEPPTDQVCTMDMAPRAQVFAAPADLEDDENAQLVLTGAEYSGIQMPIIGED